MSVSQAYKAHLLEQLAPVEGLRAKGLFGEVGLYSGDLLFGMIVDDIVVFKVDDTNRDDYDAVGVAPWIAPWNPGRPTAYRVVPAAIVRAAARLPAWAAKAVAVAARKPKKR